MSINRISGSSLGSADNVREVEQAPQQNVKQPIGQQTQIHQVADPTRGARLNEQYVRSRDSFDAQRLRRQLHNPVETRRVDSRLSNLVNRTLTARRMPATAAVGSMRDSAAIRTVGLTATPNAAIRDHQVTTSKITINDDLTVQGVKVDVNIDHTYIGDLVVKLRSPEGKEVTLRNQSGGRGSGTLQFSASPADFNGISSKGDWTLIVEDREAQDVGTLKSWSLSVTGEEKVQSPPATGRLEKTVTPNAAIKDNQTTTSVINFTEAGEVEKLTVSLDIAHTYRGDLIVKLTSPSGKEVTLHNRQGGSADNLTFEIDRSEFVGEPISGEWKLTVQDAARQDEGVLKSWGLKITPKKVTPPPPPPPPPVDIATSVYNAAEIALGRKAATDAEKAEAHKLIKQYLSVNELNNHREHRRDPVLLNDIYPKGGVELKVQDDKKVYWTAYDRMHFAARHLMEYFDTADIKNKNGWWPVGTTQAQLDQYLQSIFETYGSQIKLPNPGSNGPGFKYYEFDLPGNSGLKVRVGIESTGRVTSFFPVSGPNYIAANQAEVQQLLAIARS
ncbi:MAG: proprotein convertase P-domain-containing protein [Acidobacteriota bacterium]|nr:proprotein convertase P-domain-containing protein [Blastocatellia bacterium]MDW8412719.1 proprotein convertase P-domain-containing protein [Acidobacteriota bacterium]